MRWAAGLIKKAEWEGVVNGSDGVKAKVKVGYGKVG